MVTTSSCEIVEDWFLAGLVDLYSHSGEPGFESGKRYRLLRQQPEGLRG